MKPHSSLLLACVAATAITSSGCSGSKAGQVVLGIVTDLSWSDAPFNVRVLVFKPVSDTTAAPVVDSDDIVQLSTTMGLPGTYVLQSDTPLTLRVQVSALDGNSNEVVIRGAVFPIIPGEVRFIRLALVKSCVGKACGAQQTCVEGSCVSPLIAMDDIVDYSPQDATTLDCAGPSQLLTTATGKPMPVRGTCAPTRTCLEGSCRLSGQGP